MLLITVRGLKDARVKYDVSTDGVTIPTFSAMDIPFDQSNDFSTAHPFVGSTGHISGAHINPAVTLGFALTRHFRWRDVPLYWVAQLLGAVSASGAHRLLFGLVDDLGATMPAGSVWQSLGVEIALTFILMFVIMAVATDVRAVGHSAAIAIGATVGLEAIFAGPISGASMNPARSFGPALVGWVWSSHWIYWVGPPVGAVTGALIYRWLGANAARAEEQGSMSSEQ